MTDEIEAAVEETKPILTVVPPAPEPVVQAAEPDPDRPVTIHTATGGHVRINPMIDGNGEHYGWQMSSADRDTLARAMAAGQEVTGVKITGNDVHFRGHEVSVYAS